MRGNFRVFVASPTVIQCVEAGPGVEEAYDLLAADGVPPKKAAELAVGAGRAGRNPVAFAKHFLRLRAAVR